MSLAVWAAATTWRTRHVFIVAEEVSCGCDRCRVARSCGNEPGESHMPHDLPARGTNGRRELRSNRAWHSPNATGISRPFKKRRGLRKAKPGTSSRKPIGAV